MPKLRGLLLDVGGTLGFAVSTRCQAIADEEERLSLENHSLSTQTIALSG